MTSPARREFEAHTLKIIEEGAKPMINKNSDIWNAQANKMLDDVIARGATDNQPCREAELPDVIKFLLGEGELDGTWYGYTSPPNGKGAFWWRKALRDAWNTRTPPISYEAAIKKVSAAIADAAHGYQTANIPKYALSHLSKAALAAMGIREGKDG